MKGKKIIATLIAVASVGAAALTTGAAENRSAVDSKFYDFTAHASYYHVIDKTYRSKDNSTSVYFVYDQAKNNRYKSIRVQTLGTGGVNCTLDASGDPSDYVYAQFGVQHEVYNEIRESGYTKANVAVMSRNYVEDEYISGRWSPDCVGHFTVADK